MNITNLTGHKIKFSNGKRINPGISLRVKKESIYLKNIEGIKIFKNSYSKVDIPKQKKDTIYIVSKLVCETFPDRNDLFIPTNTVRDKKGLVIGCQGLAENPFYTIPNNTNEVSKN